MGGMATYGQGLYSTTNKQLAKQYGDVIEIPTSLLPFNPARFDSVNEFQIWLQNFDKANGLTPRERYAKWTDLGEYIASVFPEFDGIQIGTTNNAMFVTWPWSH
jgi:hypothetical protein